MDGTLDFDCQFLGGPDNINDLTPTQSIFVQIQKMSQMPDSEIAVGAT